MRSVMGQFAERSGITEGGRVAVAGMQSVHVRRHVRDIPPTRPPEDGGSQPTSVDGLQDVTQSLYMHEVTDLRTRYELGARLLPRTRRAGSAGVVKASPVTMPAAPAPLRSRHRRPISVFRMTDEDPETGRGPGTRLSGTQSIARALDILDAIATRPMMLAELAAQVGLSSTTCYRLANALVARGLLSNSGRSGYALGDRIGELGASLAEQRAKR